MDMRLKNIVDNFDKMKIGIDEPFQFHCTMCGKCCVNREDILLTPKDIFYMSKELKVTPKELSRMYCETYIGGDSRMPIVRLKPCGTIKRCPLLKDRKCSIHKAKPAVCATYPIGRCIRHEMGRDTEEITPSQITYIFMDPGCNDGLQTHTIREWLDDFGVPLEDEFFVGWHQTIMELSAILREYEKKISTRTMELIWNTVLVRLYFKYDMEKEFMLQFEENLKEVIALMYKIAIILEVSADECRA